MRMCRHVARICAWRDGTTHVVISQPKFMQSKAALVPWPRLCHPRSASRNSISPIRGPPWFASRPSIRDACLEPISQSSTSATGFPGPQFQARGAPFGQSKQATSNAEMRPRGPRPSGLRPEQPGRRVARRCVGTATLPPRALRPGFLTATHLAADYEIGSRSRPPSPPTPARDGSPRRRRSPSSGSGSRSTRR
jgi:hypothetical protein